MAEAHHSGQTCSRAEPVVRVWWTSCSCGHLMRVSSWEVKGYYLRSLHRRMLRSRLSLELQTLTNNTVANCDAVPTMKNWMLLYWHCIVILRRHTTSFVSLQASIAPPTSYPYMVCPDQWWSRTQEMRVHSLIVTGQDWCRNQKTNCLLVDVGRDGYEAARWARSNIQLPRLLLMSYSGMQHFRWGLTWWGRTLATTYQRIKPPSSIVFHEHVESLRIHSGFSLSVGESFPDPSWRNQITSMLLSKRQSASTIFCDSQISQSRWHSDIALLALPTQKTWVVT